jgi:hypothetical protein
MRHTVSGPFSAQELGNGAWQLTGSAGSEIYLRGAGAEVPELLNDASITLLDLDWCDDGVTVALTGARGVRYVKAENAIVHEPKSALYENLPLASFDADAKRFWKRVFRLMRIPGGRLLLGLIARRRR